QHVGPSQCERLRSRLADVRQRAGPRLGPAQPQFGQRHLERRLRPEPMFGRLDGQPKRLESTLRSPNCGAVWPDDRAATGGAACVFARDGIEIEGWTLSPTAIWSTRPSPFLN